MADAAPNRLRALREERGLSQVELAAMPAVSIGAADAGCATRDAAFCFGVGFVPIAEQRFDLAIPSDTFDDPRLVRLLDGMTSGPFRRELEALGDELSACRQPVSAPDAAAPRDLRMS